MKRTNSTALTDHPSPVQRPGPQDGPRRDERGVSEVIAVIVLVGITTVLAAIIGMYLLGIADDVDANPGAAVTVVEDSAANDVTITWINGDSPEYLVLNVAGATNANATANWSDDGILTGVRDTETFSAGGDDKIRIVVTAVQGDKSVVIYDGEKQL